MTKNNKDNLYYNAIRNNLEPQTINLFEAFSGIGSQYKALKNIANQQNWIIHQAGMIEWYVDAIIAYLAIHYQDTKPKIEALDNFLPISKNSKTIISEASFKKLNNTLTAYYINKSKTLCNNLFDITEVTSASMPKKIDIFTYSFPCQDLSIQGKQKGMKIEDKTRSGLLWEVKRIFQEMKDNFLPSEMPKYLLLENVKNIIGKNHLEGYNFWLKELEVLGYESKTYLLNSANFGSPQSRERVFCLSIRKDFKKIVNFEFQELEQIEINQRASLKTILEKEVDEKYYMDKLLQYKRTSENKTRNNLIKSELIGYSNFHSEAFLYNPNGTGPTLTASGANSRIKIITKDDRIRFLNPLEAYCYMGFEKKDYLNVLKTNLLSDVKITYTAGNSISVEVLEAIFKTLKFSKES